MSGETKRPAVVRARKSQSTLSSKSRQKPRPKAVARPATSALERQRTVTRYPGQGISITVQIPPLRRPKVVNSSGESPNWRRRLLKPLLLLPLLLIAIGYVTLVTNSSSDNKTPITGAPAKAAERIVPAFQPLLPSAEQASTTSYDGKRDMVTYTTAFSGARLTVSQQPLPSNFSKDTQATSKAADSIKAKQRIDTAKGPVYIATNAEAGDQIAPFAGKQTLVFIHSAGKLDDISWKSFVELLQAKAWEEVI